MTVRCFALLVALAMYLLSVLGCGAKPIGPTASPKEPPAAAAEGPSVTVTYRPGTGTGKMPTPEELIARYEEEDRRAAEAHARLLDALAKDPRPVHDLAVKAVRDRLPGLLGDKRARATEVVLDEGETETFGGAKWVVRGRLVEAGGQAGDSGRSLPREETPWYVEVRAEGAKLRASVVSAR